MRAEEEERLATLAKIRELVSGGSTSPILLCLQSACMHNIAVYRMSMYVSSLLLSLFKPMCVSLSTEVLGTHRDDTGPTALYPYS